MEPPSPQASQSDIVRKIACARCRHRKKKCDHALPSCGACKQSGVECIPYGSRRDRDYVKVPVSYLRQLKELSSATPSSRRESLFSSSSSGDNLVGHIGPGNPNYGPSSVPSFIDGDDSRDVTGVAIPAQRDQPQSSSPARIGHPPAQSEHGELSYHTETSDLNEPSVSPILSPNVVRQSAETAPKSLPISAYGILRASPLDPACDSWMLQYASMYYQHIQPQWPFLEDNYWEPSLEWASTYSSSNPSANPPDFIRRILLAIGALLCEHVRQDGLHVKQAHSLHDAAIKECFVGVMHHSSVIVRTQASLILLLYYMHSKCPNAIKSAVDFMLFQCNGLQIEHGMNEGSNCNGVTPELVAASTIRQQQSLRRRIIMTCHAVNEIIASGWTFPAVYTTSHLDEKLFEYASRFRLQDRQCTRFDHLFQLRCLQSKFRHYNKKLSSLEPNDQFRQWCRTRLWEELDEWKYNLQTVTQPHGHAEPVCHSSSSMLKLYGYSLSILSEDEPSKMSGEALMSLAQACCEACNAFAETQAQNSVMFWTWSSLIYQFRVGIIAVYCYWINNRGQPGPADGLAALPNGLHEGTQCCLSTLNRFAQKWPDAVVMYQTYECLLSLVFWSTNQRQDNILAPPSDMSDTALNAKDNRTLDDRIHKLRQYIRKLREQHVHKAIVSLVEEIASEAAWQQTAWTEATEPLFYMKNMDFFNCEPPDLF